MEAGIPPPNISLLRSLAREQKFSDVSGRLSDRES